MPKGKKVDEYLVTETLTIQGRIIATTYLYLRSSEVIIETILNWS